MENHIHIALLFLPSETGMSEAGAVQVQEVTAVRAVRRGKSVASFACFESIAAQKIILSSAYS